MFVSKILQFYIIFMTVFVLTVVILITRKGIKLLILRTLLLW